LKNKKPVIQDKARFDEQIEKLQNFRANHQYRKTTINGNKWEYLRSGKGKEIILLLTGGTRVGESYAVFPTLEKQYLVISPTYPIIYKLDQLIIDIAEILRIERISKVNILGTSLGGIIAQGFVRKYPEMVKKLIIANTMPPTPEYYRRNKLIVFLLRLLPRFIVKRISRKQLLSMFEGTPIDNQDFWYYYFEELNKHYMDKYWIIAQFLIARDFSINYQYSPNDLLEWSGKMLIIDSEFDSTFSPEIQKRLKALYPKAKKYTIKNAGHVTALSNKDEFFSVLYNFIND